MMKSENTSAPPKPIAISKMFDCKKICMNPPIIKMHRPANNLKCKSILYEIFVSKLMLAVLTQNAWQRNHVWFER